MPVRPSTSEPLLVIDVQPDFRPPGLQPVRCNRSLGRPVKLEQLPRRVAFEL